MVDPYPKISEQEHNIYVAMYAKLIAIPDVRLHLSCQLHSCLHFVKNYIIKVKYKKICLISLGTLRSQQRRRGAT